MGDLLTGRTAFVSGSSRGIGFGIARSLATAGADVVLHGREPGHLAQAVDALHAEGLRVASVCGALDNPIGSRAVHTAVLERVGTPDVVVANAGGSTSPPGPVEDVSPAEWDKVVADNLTATFLTLRAHVPGMRRRGSGVVITLSSTAVRIPDAQSPPAYAAAKAAVEMLTKTVAVQAGPDGVRANCIAPGTVVTDANRALLAGGVGERVAASYPLRRLGLVQDVADAALFLASDASRWITGTVLDVAGGSSTT